MDKENTSSSSSTHEAEAVMATQTEAYDDLKARHKKELKDLQARVTSLKRTVTQGDKKKKKEVTAEIARLEKDLKQQQGKEEKEWKAQNENTTASGSSSSQQNPDSGATVAAEDEEDDFDINDIPIDHLTIDPTPVKSQPQAQQSKGKKPNRQRARQERKAQAIKEIQDQAEKEAAGQVNMGEVEHKAIAELAVAMSVAVKDITADGHCLYNAIADQLLQHYSTQTTAKNLRHETAEYMRAHSDDFMPFLTNKQGDMMSDDDFLAYCTELESTAVWGGQLELVALSRTHKVPIWVVQMGSPTLKLSAEEFPTKKPLMVSYHRYMYGLGEHYNSLRPKDA
ncbi:hypothetical protein BGW38_005351 [Lunasporangiospora selenospora]|uniref:OTU domain-containing protein n=1 Tax=Lunasporangiospora selenospora TaxID=979761 RepID=A0A9P6FPA1_9FUNG|nr:hypothetical protein BGW38_005351 [Lunasporangiospora selenospora]